MLMIVNIHEVKTMSDRCWLNLTEHKLSRQSSAADALLELGYAIRIIDKSHIETTPEQWTLFLLKFS